MRARSIGHLSPAVALIACCIAVPGSTGCAPVEWLQNPRDWPEQLVGRHLYNGQHAYVYAGTESAAREAEHTAKTAAEDFREEAADMGLSTEALLNMMPVPLAPDEGQPR